MMNKRVYSYYTTEEFKLLEKKCEQIGMSPSAYQKYLALMGLQVKAYDVKELQDHMRNTLKTWPIGKPFIVSSLLEKVWPSLDRSTKTTLAKTLARDIDEDTEYKWEVKRANNKTATQYTKKKKEDPDEN